MAVQNNNDIPLPPGASKKQQADGIPLPEGVKKKSQQNDLGGDALDSDGQFTFSQGDLETQELSAGAYGAQETRPITDTQRYEGIRQQGQEFQQSIPDQITSLQQQLESGVVQETRDVPAMLPGQITQPVQVRRPMTDEERDNIEEQLASLRGYQGAPDQSQLTIVNRKDKGVRSFQSQDEMLEYVAQKEMGQSYQEMSPPQKAQAYAKMLENYMTGEQYAEADPIEATQKGFNVPDEAIRAYEEESGARLGQAPAGYAATQFIKGASQIVPSVVQYMEMAGDVGAGAAPSFAPSTGQLDINENIKAVADKARNQGYTGQKLSQELDQLFPNDPEKQGQFIYDLAQGAGNMASFVAGGAALGGAAPFVLGAMMNGTQMYNEAIEMGADPETAFATFAIGTATGASEGLPILSFLNKANKVSGGAIKYKILPALRKRLANSAQQGTEEFIQEFGMSLVNNLTAQQLYDFSREIITDEALREGAIGAVLGSIMGVAIPLNTDNPQLRQARENFMSLSDPEVQEGLGLMEADQEQQQTQTDETQAQQEEPLLEGVRDDRPQTQEGAEGAELRTEEGEAQVTGETVETPPEGTQAAEELQQPIPGTDFLPEDIDQIEDSDIKSLKHIARGGYGDTGFYAFDREYPSGLKGGYREAVINDDANILYLVEGDYTNYEVSEQGANRLRDIVGEEAFNEFVESGAFEGEVEITNALWDNKEVEDALRSAGIDIVVGQTVDGVFPVVLNKDAITIKQTEDATQQQSGAMREETQQVQEQVERDTDMPEVDRPVVQDRPQEQVQEETIITEGRKYDVFRTTDGLIEARTKEGEIAPKSAQRDANYKVAQTQDFNAGKTAIQKERDGELQGDPRDYNSLEEMIAAESDNPAEVALTMQAVDQFVPASDRDVVQERIAEVLPANGINARSWNRFGDPNKTGDVAYWVDKNNEQGNLGDIDRIAQEASLEDLEVTPQDVVDFMESYSSHQAYAQQENPTYTALAERLSQLTGLDPTLTKNARLIAERYDEATVYPTTTSPTAEGAAAPESQVPQPAVEGAAELEARDNTARQYGFTNIHHAANAVKKYIGADVTAETVTEEQMQAASEAATPTVEEEIEREQISERKVGAAIVASPSDLGRIWNWTKGKWRKHFKARGDLPQSVFDKWIGTLGKESAAIKKTARLRKRLEDATKKNYGVGYNKLSATQKRGMDKALRGDKTELDKLPNEIAAVISDMRRQIDALSDIAVIMGVVEGDLALTFTNNMGVYLTRTYRKFNDPEKWMKEIPESVRNRAKSFIRNEYPDFTESEVNGLINNLLYNPKNDISVFRQATVGSKSVDILKNRKDIPKPLRDLYGEYSDPFTNYANSLTKLTSLIARDKFLKQVREDGLGVFLFERPQSEFYVQLAGESSQTMSPLNGLYTSPEIAQAFKGFDPQSKAFDGGIEHFTRTWLTVNGLVKGGKTIASPQTHVRNFTGNGLIMVNNGYFLDAEFYKQFSNATKTTFFDIFDKGDQAVEDYIVKLTELRVLDESVNAGDLKGLINDIDSSKGSLIDSITNTVAGKLVKATKDTAARLYQAEDDFFKIIAYEVERKRLDQAYGETQTDQWKDERAAKKVRMVLPTYSLVPRFIKQLRKFPITGTFVSFPFEILRTYGNTVMLTHQELTSPEERAIGIKRLTGLVTNALSVPIVSALTKAMIGVDDEEVEAARRMMAPWTRFSDIFWLQRDDDGLPRFMDFGYSDPYNYIRKPINSIILGAKYGEGVLETTIDAAVEMLKPYVGEEILFQHAIEIRTNQKLDGGRIYNPQDDPEVRFLKSLEHLSKAVEPGVVTSSRRIYKGFYPEESRNARAYDPYDEIRAVALGQRIQRLDPINAIRFKAVDFNRDMRDAKAIFNAVKYRLPDNPSPEQLRERDEAYQNSIEKMERAYNEIQKDYEAVITLMNKTVGLEKLKEKIAYELKEAGISKATIKQLETGGSYIPFDKETGRQQKSRPSNASGQTFELIE